MEVLLSGSKMRLNEKNVINFATCNSPVDKEGWLLKKAPDAPSGHGRGFQKRYFTLKGNLLFYFEKKGDKEPQGVIIMEGCTVELVEVADQAYTFGIHFQGPGARTYIMAAEDQEVMASWMKVLSCATYEYMRLMVAELQRQLDEINAAERAKARQLKESVALQQQHQQRLQSVEVGAKTVSSSRTESSLSMASSSNSDNAGLEEDDFFDVSSSGGVAASPASGVDSVDADFSRRSTTTAANNDDSPLSRRPGKSLRHSEGSKLATSTSVDSSNLSTTTSALYRASSPSRLNPVGATVVQDMDDIVDIVRASRSSLSPGAGGRGSVSPTSNGDNNNVISDMHIVDRRSPLSPSSSSAGTTTGLALSTSPRSFADMHKQFGQPIVQQIQSRKSSSSAMSSASSEEFY